MTTYFAEFGMRDGKRVPITLFRRDIPGDVKSDGAYSKDGTWPFTTALALSMKNLGDDDIEQVTEAEAEQFIALVTARNLA
jgi:hypothetical protein